MLTTRLIQLVETQAGPLAQAAVQDILSDERTRCFRKVPRAESEARLIALYQNLGRWLAAPKENGIREEYEYWGKTRFQQRIPLREIIYSLILSKKRLRRFIREHGLIAFSGDRIAPGELVPVELYGIQELNYLVGDFFDQALYYLASGYEAAAQASQSAA